MKIVTFLISLLCLFLMGNLGLAQETKEACTKIKIPERTVIPVKLIQPLKGDSVIMGQVVDFEVSQDIIINNYIVIRRAAPAYATVTAADKAGYVSQGGKISLSMDYCKAIDGSKIYLRSMLGREAEDHMGANIAASVLICPLILAAKGEEAEIPVGTEFKAYVENDSIVTVLVGTELSHEEIQQIQQKELEERERLEKERIEQEKREKLQEEFDKQQSPANW